ncbi:MAG: aminotransferase, partial [Candidatus Bipolaricaulota bacterium]
VRARCREFLDGFSERVQKEIGLQPLSSGPDPWPLQMRAFALPPCDRRALQHRLFDRWHIEVPVIPWNGRFLLRVSVQGYNTAHDLDVFTAALTEALRS